MAEALPVLAREAIADLRAHLAYLDERISRYERQLVELARQREAAVRIQRLPGVGPLTASAITARISDGHEFANRRQFAPWLGLVPRAETWPTNELGPLARLVRVARVPKRRAHFEAG